MESSPFLSALSPDRHHQDMAGETAITGDQLRHVLTFMVVITTVSFFLVFLVVTALVVFMCFARNRLRRGGCTCHNNNNNSSNCGKIETGAMQIRGHHIHPGTLANNTVLIGQGQGHHTALPSQIMTRGPPVNSGQVTATGGHGGQGGQVTAEGSHRVNQKLVPATATLTTTRVATDNKDECGSSRPEVRYGVRVNPGFCDSPARRKVVLSGDTAEPIYEEIGGGVTCHEYNNNKQKEQQKMAVLEEEEQTKSTFGEKEQMVVEKELVGVEKNCFSVDKKSSKSNVEYWQITAKEVVKFRPCTETFIARP